MNVPTRTICFLALVATVSPRAVAQEGRNPTRAADLSTRPLRIGIIGLDTSHSSAFARIFNQGALGDAFDNCRVVAAVAQGSRDIASSVDRVPEIVRQVQALGVETVPSIDALLERVDCVMLESNDGRVHLEQALPVLRHGLPLFVDKPVAASLADVVAIYDAAERFGTPLFTSSALRYAEGVAAVSGGAVGRIVGCDAFSPCPLEETHTDFFWYGIHGVETLFTAMGTGCQTVVRFHSPDTDVAVGVWQDGRVGTFRGRRKPDNGYEPGYGGTAFGSEGIRQLGGFTGYEPLLVEVARFFRTGKPPIAAEETLEIYAFMEAADESRRRDGAHIELKQVLIEAREAAQQRLQQLHLGE